MEESGADSTAEEPDALTRNVWSTAARAALARDLPMTVCHDGRRLRFHPDGYVEDLRSATLRTDVEGTPAPIASGFDTANPALAKFDLPNIEVPAAFRELAETVAAMANVSFENAEATIEDTPEELTVATQSKTADGADDAIDDVPEERSDDAADIAARESHTGTIATTAASTTEYSLKFMEAACINANAMIEFASVLLQAKSLSEMVVLSTAHARKQIETVTEQAKQLAEVAEKMSPKKAEATEADGTPDVSDSDPRGS